MKRVKYFTVHYHDERGEQTVITEGTDETDARKRFKIWYPEIEIKRIKEDS